MVLTSPPVEVQSTGSEELMSALRSGLPALVWHPSAPPADVHEIIMSLTSGDDGLADLPARVQAQRNRTFLGDADAAVFGDLVLLWDDPSRLVVVDLSPGQPLKGERG
jgi:vWA-MoxR associated protein C-terminal domain